ncbi:hypothetical protein ALC56_09749 [Trachymyrmex septentrionalis]|uniref:Uncharacterized protein n=1 Tax=Trachymyrmex septentrionalis TaxID=34720 RepID=A0A195F661_9HYME|nr:hypothetical protein ALC56_09749 [Trachymyrmex septentrionalis]
MKRVPYVAFLCTHPKGPKMLQLAAAKYMKNSRSSTGTEEDGMANAKKTKKRKKLQSLSRGEKPCAAIIHVRSSSARSAFEAWQFGDNGRAVSYRPEGSIENHRENGESGRTFGNNVKMGRSRRKWSGFIAAPEVAFVRSAKTEGRASGHYAATIASLSTVCNVTCLRGLEERAKWTSWGGNDSAVEYGDVCWDRSTSEAAPGQEKKERRRGRCCGESRVKRLSSLREGKKCASADSQIDERRKHVDLNNRSTFAAGPTTKPIGKFCTERQRERERERERGFHHPFCSLYFFSRTVSRFGYSSKS